MLWDQIVAREEQFDADGRVVVWDATTQRTVWSRLPRTARTIAIPHTDEVMSYVDVRPGHSSFYDGTKHAKKQVVLHFTEGQLHSDLGLLTRAGRRLSVAFVIGQTGTIYNLFSSAAWSYHLGAVTFGNNTTNSRESVAIEMCNLGRLVKVGQELHTPAGTAYCTLDDHDAYVEASYRGYDYWAAFSDGQYEALITLLRYLCATYDIAPVFLAESQRFDTFAGIPGFRGIVSHVNYRATHKWDIGPAFDWDRVIQGVRGTVSAPL